MANVNDSEPSRKRPRLEEDDLLETTFRDQNYFFSDGSCVLKIQNTLFNELWHSTNVSDRFSQVHRTIMSADGSTFGGMFQMPMGNGQPLEGTEDNPVVLTGDSVGEFRNFLWALYSLPHELTSVYSPDADLTRLIDIAHIANKYSFKSTETWALDAIQEYINRKPCPITPTPVVQSSQHLDTALPRVQLTRLVRLAQMCNHEKLLGTLVALLRTLMVASSEWAYLALSLADELEVKDLRGAAYLEVLQKNRIVLRKSDPSMVAGTLDGEGRLIVTHGQQLRLLSGYYHLTGAWERLRAQPPNFDHASGCGATWHKHGCTQSWVEFWRDKTKSDSVLSLGLADVIGRLKTIVKEFDRWGSVPHIHPECRMAARRAIVDKVKHIEDQLSDFFQDEGE